MNLWVPASALSILSLQDFVEKLGNVNVHTDVATKPQNGMPVIVGTHEIWVELNVEIDVDKEREELEKEKVYYDGFIASVRKKLENERFVQNAKPEVIALERKKEADAMARIHTIEATLSQMDSE